MEPGDEVEAVDNIRLGDIVFFDRTGPKTVALRALSPEEAAKISGKKYRIDRGSKPGSFKLTQLED
jgi:hypothetical protein